MTRRLETGRLVLASHNPGKLREIAELVEPYGLEVVSAGELGLPEPEETGKTFAENARLKAVAAAIGVRVGCRATWAASGGHLSRASLVF